MSDESVLELDGVTKVYGEEPPVPALRGVSFSVRRGELVAIVGPSGSGKSTLLHVIGTLERPSTGIVRIGGVDAARLGDRDPLPLPSGELGGLEGRAFGKADPFERLVGAAVSLGGGDAGVEQAVGDVLAHRRVFGQEELLEDEADVPSPKPRQLAVAEARRVDPTDPYDACAGPLQCSDDV